MDEEPRPSGPEEEEERKELLELLDLMHDAASSHTFGSPSSHRKPPRRIPHLPPRKPGGGFFAWLRQALRRLLRG